MDLNLKQEKIKYIRSLYRGSTVKEETSEVIVPDALPDIMRIIDTDAAVVLRSKEASGGRVSISGNVNLTVIYLPDGVSGIRKMEVSLPVNITAESEGIDQDSLITAKLSLISADSKAVNPRKIMARANILIGIECFGEDTLSLVTGAEGEGECGIETLSKRETLCLVSDVSEKTFIVSDEFKLPSSKPPIGEILKTKVTLLPDEVKSIGSKVIFKGNAEVLMYYRSEDNDLESAEFSSSFSQVMDFESDGNHKFDVVLMPTGIYANPELNSADEMKNVLFEIHAVAQCCSYTEKEISFISDAYSNRYLISDAKSQTETDSFAGTETVSEITKINVETPTPAKNVVGTNVSAGLVSIDTESGGKLKADIHLSVTFISDDGRLITISKRGLAETSFALPENAQQLSAEAVIGSEVYSSISADGIDVRVPVVFTVKKYEQKIIIMVSALSCDEENLIDLSGKPSVILRRIRSGDTLWNLAKRYNSTPELIRDANGIEDELNLEIGRLIIIPKKR